MRKISSPGYGQFDSANQIFFLRKNRIIYCLSAQTFAEGVQDVEFDVGKSGHGGQGEVLKFVVAANVLAHTADAFSSTMYLRK